MGDTFPDIDKYLKKENYGISNVLYYEDTTVARTCILNGHVYMFFRREDVSTPMDESFVHESIHAASEVIEHLGADYSYKNQEMLTYLVQYIFKVFKGIIYNEQKNSDLPRGGEEEVD